MGGRAGASTGTFSPLKPACCWQNVLGYYQTRATYSCTLEPSVSKNPVAYSYQLPCFHCLGGAVLFHPLPLRVLERRHGISVGGSSFPNGYCWKKKSKAKKTTATRSLHHPHIHLPMRYLSALSGEIFFFYCLFTVVFLTPKTSAQPIINSHYIVNESHSLNTCWTLMKVIH